MAAVAACRHLDDASENTDSVRDWLVIHDLHAPANQDQEFAECLKRIAHAIGRWENVVYLAPSQIQELTKLTRHQGQSVATQQLAEWLNLPPIDEVYLSQNQVLLNGLLSQLFSSATKTCYGDGIGVNFSPDYFLCRSTPSFTKKIRSAVFNPIQRLIGRGPVSSAEFDRHALLLPNLFDEQRERFEQVQPHWSWKIFDQIQIAMRSDLARILSPLNSALKTPNDLVILLTTNFSEAGRMNEGPEIEAYVNLVRAQRSNPDAVVLVKPHPRDSAGKMERLREALQHTFSKVFVLDDPLSFYLPFESILRAILLSNDQLSQRTRLICVSSSCLSLELLFGIRCELGFGESVVREHFSDVWKERRVQHERDLLSAVQKIRKVVAIRAAA